MVAMQAQEVQAVHRCFTLQKEMVKSGEIFKNCGKWLANGPSSPGMATFGPGSAERAAGRGEEVFRVQRLDGSKSPTFDCPPGNIGQWQWGEGALIRLLGIRTAALFVELVGSWDSFITPSSSHPE